MATFLATAIATATATATAGCWLALDSGCCLFGCPHSMSCYCSDLITVNFKLCTVQCVCLLCVCLLSIFINIVFNCVHIATQLTHVLLTKHSKIQYIISYRIKRDYCSEELYSEFSKYSTAQCSIVQFNTIYFFIVSALQ